VIILSKDGVPIFTVASLPHYILSEGKSEQRTALRKIQIIPIHQAQIISDLAKLTQKQEFKAGEHMKKNVLESGA
jgi:hypothetical protein